jgi:peptidoglycan hydrolase-like protein with peptidoglycan-binding domain
VSLLAAGRRPLVKIGSDQQAVWRLQRSLTAAGVRTPIDGVLADPTARAVKVWQHRLGRARTGVVGPDQWQLLLNGRVGRAG